MAEPHQRYFGWREQDGVCVVAIAGDAGSLSGDLMNRQLEPVLDQLAGKAQPQVIVDFQQMPYFGSALLEDLLRIWRMVQDAGGRMVLCNLSRAGRELIDLARFERLWPVFSNLPDALTHLQQTSAE